MTYDFPEHISGDTWSGINAITIQSAGSAVNLSSCDIFIRVRSFHNVASPIVYEFSTLYSTINIISATEGKISIPPQTIDIPAGTYNYDLKIKFPSGNKKTYLAGKWEILPSIIM
jgi:hypothetical protein